MDKLFKEKIKLEIRRILKEETEYGRFLVLTDRDVDLLTQIVVSEIMAGNIKPENFRSSSQNVEKRNAELIFIAAPTGAGKDTLVRKVAHDNADKKYVVLNMDMFRHYFPVFENYLREKYPEGLTDRTFAIQTNEFSYEIYYTMQRLLLENFPGTNIIITGTIRETSWVEETFSIFKSNTYTDYTNKLFALAVPKKVCEISAIERYLCSIKIYDPGTARYVSNDYYSDTTENFIANLKYFENTLDSRKGIIDVIEVYKRSARQNDFNEDTLLYTSDASKRKNPKVLMSANQVVAEILNYDCDVGFLKIATLLDRVESMRDYLIQQGVYREILMALQSLNKRENSSKSTQKINVSVKKIDEDGNNDGEKYPGSED